MIMFLPLDFLNTLEALHKERSIHFSSKVCSVCAENGRALSNGVVACSVSEILNHSDTHMTKHREVRQLL